MGLVFTEFSHNLSHTSHLRCAHSQDVLVLSRVLVFAIRGLAAMKSTICKPSDVFVMLARNCDDSKGVVCQSVLLLYTSSEPDGPVK